MSDQDTNDYRFEALEARADKTDEKLDTILQKIDTLRSELLLNRCSQPNLCVLLRQQMADMAATLTRLNNRLDQRDRDDKEEFDRIDSDLDSIRAWRNWMIGVSVPILAILSYFSEEIKMFFFK